ncbi:MAG: MBL fold metallo-hydrolase, partial [Flavobacteriales bacterium]|nr:MBL fold metallo-hydrolase [Flavobacteriales bacterium]
NARGQHFHTKGRGNGYVLSFGGFNVYVAGDTEIIPEMQALEGRVDVAFMPLCVPFTMSAQMWEDAVREIKPKVAYPYHCTEVDVTALQKVLPDVEIKA